MGTTESNDNYYVALLDQKTNKPVGDEVEFKTLEEVLGWLHKIQEPNNLESILKCLMGLRDGECKVVISREMFQVGEQTLRIKPPERFVKLFWKGFGLE